MQEERIYIGGLDPYRLKASEVLSRLKNIDGIQIQSTSLVDDAKSFFYVNAASNSPNKSALDIIVKLYNNVTWKQCKLIVQAARPHFLQRLEQERLERQRERIENGEAQQQHPNAIPRHLRIRQKYGQEAYPVDTKPCQTQDWNDFCRVLGKLRTRRQNGKDQLADGATTKKRVSQNRAVHLRWTDDTNINGVLDEPLLVGESMASNDTESSSDDSSSDSSDESTGSPERSPMKNGMKLTYVWSDDNSNSDSCSEEEDDAASVDRNENVIGQRQAQSPSSSSDESVSSESDKRDNEKRDEAEYQWSSGSNDESNVGADLPRKAPSSSLVPASTQETTEFSAAIDFHDAASSENDGDMREEENADSSKSAKFPADSTNLDDDVKTNLSVLSSLFPEMAKTKPLKVDNDRNSGETQSYLMQPGWEMGSSGNGLGLMQRYDPTKESAKKFILEEPSKPASEDESEKTNKSGSIKDDESTSSDESESQDSVSKEDEPKSYGDTAESDAQPEESGSKAAVYEQSKLEGIFRQARSSDGGTAFKMSSMFDEKIEEEGGKVSDKPFAFGFDLGGETPAVKKQSQAQANDTFAFGFNVGVNESSDKERGKEAEKDVAFHSLDRNETMPPSSNESKDEKQGNTGIQRRGFFFPEDVLEEYTKEFFAMNEGARIREDPQGFVRDEGIKQQWKKERHALTLDWKRKRKYAQSRMQKKMKFR